MKPKPLSSLNHLTVPVAMSSLPGLCAAKRGRCISNSYERGHCYVGHFARHENPSLAGLFVSLGDCSTFPPEWLGLVVVVAAARGRRAAATYGTATTAHGWANIGFELFTAIRLDDTSVSARVTGLTSITAPHPDVQNAPSSAM